MRFLHRYKDLFDTVVMVFVLSILKVVLPSKLGETSCISQNGAYLAPWEGSPVLGGRLADHLVFFQWVSSIGRPPMAVSPLSLSGAVVISCRFAVSPRFLRFSGLFLKCRHRIDVILVP